MRKKIVSGPTATEYLFGASHQRWEDRKLFRRFHFFPAPSSDRVVCLVLFSFRVIFHAPSAKSVGAWTSSSRSWITSANCSRMHPRKTVLVTPSSCETAVVLAVRAIRKRTPPQEPQRWTAAPNLRLPRLFPRRFRPGFRQWRIRRCRFARRAVI